MPGVVLAWLLCLGWRAERWQNPDGSTGGPYHPWQVEAFVVAVAGLAVLSMWRGFARAAGVATALAVTGMFAADASGTDDSGLWAVGALMTLIGSVLGTWLLAALIKAHGLRCART